MAPGPLLRRIEAVKAAAVLPAERRFGVIDHPAPVLAAPTEGKLRNQPAVPIEQAAEPLSGKTGGIKNVIEVSS